MKHLIPLNGKLRIDLWKLIVSRLLIQANSGGGKSWATRWLLEQTHGKVQQIVIDPEGEFSTLREKFEYIIAGKDGDTPADPRVAAKLAERLLELGVSAIIDLYELSPADRKRFVRLFFEAMINAPKKLWHPVLVVLDEAHKFAPEKEESEAREAVIDMASRGRKRGFCLVPATQRPAKLSKDVAAECNNKLIGRASLDIDRKRSAEELGFNTKEEVLSLRNLEPGEFYVFGPAISKDVEKITIGSVQTSHPKAGGRIGKRRIAKPSEAIRKALGKLADLPKEAEEEAITLTQLRAENTTLKRENTQLKRQGPKVVAPAVVNATEVRVREQLVKEHKAMSELLPKMDKTIKDQQGVIDTLNAGITQVGKLITSINHAIKKRGIRPLYVAKLPIIKPIDIRPGAVVSMGVDMARPGSRDKSVAVTIEHKQDGTKEVIDVQDVKLGKCDRLIYSFLFQNQGREFSKEQVGAIIQYSPSSSTFNNALSRLHTLGMIHRNNGKLSLARATPDDQQWLVAIDVFSADPDLWDKKLGKCERDIYRFVYEHPNDSFGKEDLGERISYSPLSSTFNNALSHLNTIGLIRREGGRIKINPEIMEL